MKNWLTISNLFPRPDHPQFGMFNLQLFSELARRVVADGGTLHNLCPVPLWNPGAWARTQGWACPHPASPPTRYVPVFYIPVIGRALSARTYAWSLRRQIVQDNADVVFASWLYPDGVVAARCAAPEAAVWLMALGSDTHHLDAPPRGAAILEACSRSQGVVCVWAGLRDRLVRAGVPSDRVHVVPNGVNPERFRFRSRIEARTTLGERADLTGAPLLLFVGNLVPVKGPDLCLQALVRIVNTTQGRGARLLVIGDGPMRPELEREARRLGVPESVVFLGRRPHDEIALWMNLADCLCLSSRSEGMPNVVREALASGLPVVAADVGACREMLSGEKSGRVVAPESSETLAQAILALTALEHDREGLARRHGAYTWADQAARVYELVKGSSAF